MYFRVKLNVFRVKLNVFPYDIECVSVLTGAGRVGADRGVDAALLRGPQ